MHRVVWSGLVASILVYASSQSATLCFFKEGTIDRQICFLWNVHLIQLTISWFCCSSCCVNVFWNLSISCEVTLLTTQRTWELCICITCKRGCNVNCFVITNARHSRISFFTRCLAEEIWAVRRYFRWTFIYLYFPLKFFLFFLPLNNFVWSWKHRALRKYPPLYFLYNICVRSLQTVALYSLGIIAKFRLFYFFFTQDKQTNWSNTCIGFKEEFVLLKIEE